MNGNVAIGFRNILPLNWSLIHCIEVSVCVCVRLSVCVYDVHKITLISSGFWAYSYQGNEECGHTMHVANTVQPKHLHSLLNVTMLDQNGGCKIFF